MSALFSTCGNYRYRLDRALGGGRPLAFLLHNPSTAGDVADDATSRRGIGYARSLGFGRLIFINPWARIATRPRDLWAAEDPVGPLNDMHIYEAIQEIRRDGGILIGAWGRLSPPVAKRDHAAERIRGILALVRQNGMDLAALGVNKDGSPKHPLYVRRDARPSSWVEKDLPER